MEYPFWEERNPEALGRFGEPIVIENNSTVGKEQWREILENGLRNAQRKLAQDSLDRNSHAFEVLLSGKSGVVWMYDIVRRLRSLITGKKLEKSHSDKLQ